MSWLVLSNYITAAFESATLTGTSILNHILKHCYFQLFPTCWFLSRMFTIWTGAQYFAQDCTCTQHSWRLIRVFYVRLKMLLAPWHSQRALRRLWSDCADAQADLSLRWAHMHSCRKMFPGSFIITNCIFQQTYQCIVLLLMLRIISPSASLVSSGMSSIISVSTRDPPFPNDTLKLKVSPIETGSIKRLWGCTWTKAKMSLRELWPSMTALRKIAHCRIELVELYVRHCWNKMGLIKNVRGLCGQWRPRLGCFRNKLSVRRIIPYCRMYWDAAAYISTE